MKKTLLTAIAMSALLISLVFTTCSHPVRADSTDFINFDSGVTIFSPINTTYTSRHVTLNLTIYSVGIMGLDPGVSMNYSIDGIYNGPVPIRNSDAEMHFIANGAGTVDLPELPNGSHCLTLFFESLNRKTYEPKYVSYVNTVYFTIDDTNTISNPTPSPSPTPNLTPSSSPSPSPTILPTPTASPSITPSPSIPEFPSRIILPIFTVATLLSIVFIKGRIAKKITIHKFLSLMENSLF